MSWKTLNRIDPAEKSDRDGPALSEPVRAKIRSFFDRYETKHAVLLPALHVVQDALGSIPADAMVELAELLEIYPTDVVNTVSFYTHFWTHPRGEKVIVLCRSVTCEVMGSAQVLEAIKSELGIGDHETTADGKFSLMTEECLAGCDHGPCMLINEKLHKCVKPEDIPAILSDPANDKLDCPRSDLFDAPPVVATATAVAEDSSGDGESGEA